MRSRYRSLVILLCLLLITFRAAAGSVFIEAAIERAQMQQTLFSEYASDPGRLNKETSDGQQQSHSLFLMSHVTANISDTNIIVSFQPSELVLFNCLGDILTTQNFPDSAFKPPKVSA
ncbi:hypothetical protein ICN42_08250 [Polynucleobacter sp. 71A-WALBACH]|uniref:hypothetical protein n=1 Tax=Polynucleobacter sp. 71A-WALBACH TaxID=2689097 RepID=UPI001C0BA68C|nr:hypothetical protein [Polynucleobacter sp. 71A-WALBACH]MBU3594083.1 hypothetical protein [Polynucleobacter sp. 71A-WALBACH]